MLRLRDGRWVLLAVVALAAALLTGARVPWFLFYSLALLLLLSALWCWRLHRQLQAELSAARPLLRVGDGLALALRLQNRGRLPLPWLEVDHPGLPAAVAAPDPTAVGTALPVGTQVLPLTALARRRGRYRYGPVRVRVGDGLGLFAVERCLFTPDPVTVLPAAVDLGGLVLPPGQPLGEQRARRRAFDDPAEIAEVRPYLPGDSPRHIHWRTTARKGALHTKTFAPTAATALVVCLDLGAGAHDAPPELASLEDAIGLAAGLAALGEERRLAVGLLTTGRERRYLPPGFRQTLPLLAALAAAEADGHEDFAGVLAAASHLWSAQTTLCVVTPALTPTLTAVLLRLVARWPVVLFRVSRSDPGPAGADLLTGDGLQVLAGQGVAMYDVAPAGGGRPAGTPRVRPVAPPAMAPLTAGSRGVSR